MLTLVATVDAGTGGSTITNTATITAADQADPNGTNNSDTADITVQSADLAVTKVVDDGTPNEGDTVTYTVTLTNNGPNDATGIEVTDLLPAGVTYQSDTPSQGSYASGTGLWTAGDLATAANAMLTLVATVDAGTGGSTITNTATITAADQATRRRSRRRIRRIRTGRTTATRRTSRCRAPTSGLPRWSMKGSQTRATRSPTP
jgi:uncharacterized repeat protein (TIGR01451 family)